MSTFFHLVHTCHLCNGVVVKASCSYIRARNSFIGQLCTVSAPTNRAGNRFNSQLTDSFTSIVDNVPLVAGCMGMYPLAATGDFAVDGIFWQLLAYCAGVGGSMLIIGSAAGVVAMGLEKISFGWYMKHISWIAFLGYIAGIFSYFLLRTFIF